MRHSEARRRLACPPLARRARAPHERGAGGGSDPLFYRWCGTRGRVRWTCLWPPYPLPQRRGSLPPQRSLREGRRVGQEADSGKQQTTNAPQAERGTLTVGAVSSGKGSPRQFPFAEQIIAQNPCRAKCDILNQPIDARHSLEAWRVYGNRVRPHSALGSVSPEKFRLAGETGRGKAGRCATLENSPNFPLFCLDDADCFPAADHKWPSGRERQTWGMHTTRYLRSAARAACHPT